MANLILGLLIFQPLTIYQLNQAFKKGLAMIYTASYGSLQNAVKKLLLLDYIVFQEVVENGRNKKIYQITPDGKNAFFKWMYEPIPESKLETYILSKVYFLGLVNDTEKKEILESMIQQIEGSVDEMSTYKSELDALSLPEEQMEIAKYQFETLNYGIGTHQFGLDWLKKIYKDL